MIKYFLRAFDSNGKSGGIFGRNTEEKDESEYTFKDIAGVDEEIFSQCNL